MCLAALIPFWSVDGTEPSGSGALWALYGALIASALIWAVATWGIPALLVAAGFGTVGGGIAVDAFSVPWPHRAFVFAGALLIAAGGVVLVKRWRSRGAGVGRHGLADDCRELADELERFVDSRRLEPAVALSTDDALRVVTGRLPGPDAERDKTAAVRRSFRNETSRLYQEQFRKRADDLLARLAEDRDVRPQDRSLATSARSLDQMTGVADMFRRFAVELTPLPERIEALVREGFRVQDFIQSGLIPSNGKPSEEAVERANDFRARCTALMREAGSTPLEAFETAGNAYRRENSGPRTTKDIREAFAGMAWDGLLIDVQASMCGLEAAQKELGRLADRQLASRSRAS